MEEFDRLDIMGFVRLAARLFECERDSKTKVDFRGGFRNEWVIVDVIYNCDV